MLKLTNKDFVDFNYHEIGKAIRCTYINGEPWFVAIDACKILEYKQPIYTVRDMIDKSKTMVVVGPTKEGSNYVGKMTLISYGALNKLVINSRMPKAKEFGDWIFDVVIPTIHYEKSFTPKLDEEKIKDDPDQFIKLVSKKIMTDENMIKGLKVENNELRKKSILSQFISSSDSNFTFAEFANLLSTAGYNIGLNRLYAILRDTKYLISTGPRKNMPTQRSIEQNLVDVNIEITDTGKSRTVKTITSKGAEKFIKVIDDCLAKVNLHKDEDGQYRDEDGFIVLKPTAEQLANIKRIKKKQN